jgi:hypothetical protein
MGEKGEASLGKSFMERFGSRGARNRESPVVGRERAKREHRKKEEEEWLRPKRYRDKGASHVGALLCYKGARDVVTSIQLEP